MIYRMRPSRNPRSRRIAAVITTLGVQLGDVTFPTTATGYRRLLAWARSFGILNHAAVEGTGSYGAALANGFCLVQASDAGTPLCHL